MRIAIRVAETCSWLTMFIRYRYTFMHSLVSDSPYVDELYVIITNHTEFLS